MISYEVIDTGQGEVVKRTESDGKEFWIPKDPSNSDYQRYLAWLENPEAEHLNGSVDGEAL
jgi:hypothetical protein